MSAEKKRWKWQRARVLGANYTGRCFWVRIGPPVDEVAYLWDTRTLAPTEPRLKTNLLGRWQSGTVTEPDKIELLARSEDDFRDEVELISFADWLKQDDNAQEPAKAGEEE